MRYRSVIISGLLLSGKSTLSKELAKELGWTVYSIGTLVRLEYAKRHPSQDITFEDFFKNLTVAENKKFNDDARDPIAKGNVVGDMRFAPYYTELNPLTVFLTAPIETRVDHAENRPEYKGKNRSAIRKMLDQREKDEVKQGISVLGFDFREPSRYHLTINSQKFTLGEEVDIMKRLLLDNTYTELLKPKFV